MIIIMRIKSDIAVALFTDEFKVSYDLVDSRQWPFNFINNFFLSGRVV